MKTYLLILLLLFSQLCFSQLIIKNHSGAVLQVNSDGYVGFRTSTHKGLLNVDSLGETYSHRIASGSLGLARSCLYVETLENNDYAQNSKNIGIHTISYAEADPNDYAEPKQNIAIGAHLMNVDGTYAVGIGNLAQNMALGSPEQYRRDVIMVRGIVQNADAMLGPGHDVRRMIGVEGGVQTNYNTLNPEVVFAGYFRGAKSYFGDAVGILTETPGNDMLDVRGRAYASGGWQTTNGDYAEWFEKEGTPGSGDLIGIDPATGKARTYQAGDKFIGIHSSNPAVVGNRMKESEEEMQETHVLVGLLGQLEVDPDQITVENNLVYTKDGTYVGVMLSNDKVLVGR